MEIELQSHVDDSRNIQRDWQTPYFSMSSKRMSTISGWLCFHSLPSLRHKLRQPAGASGLRQTAPRKVSVPSLLQTLVHQCSRSQHVAFRVEKLGEILWYRRAGGHVGHARTDGHHLCDLLLHLPDLPVLLNHFVCHTHRKVTVLHYREVNASTKTEL